MSLTRARTEEDLMSLPKDGWKRELIDGEIVVSPAGVPHGRILMRLGSRMQRHVEESDLGVMLDSSTGCWMPSGNLRSPDLTFVSRERMPPGSPEGFLRVVPDLVVEVLSPGDSPRLILDKVGEYLGAGVRIVWVIDPMKREAACHRSPTDVSHVAHDGELSGEDVLPGFRCRLAEILAT